MQTSKFNVILDQAWGSSGKGKTSAYLADKYGIRAISSSNYPNAGHSAVFEDGTTFVAKAIPTALVLKRVKGQEIMGFISPGSGFDPARLIKEWDESGRPDIVIHERASVVTAEHAAREREGAESTKHIASTMQGSGTAIADKILRKADVPLARSKSVWEWVEGLDIGNSTKEEAIAKIAVVSAERFRDITFATMRETGDTWLHEGSQGYALSLDHGSHYPNCTSRNCTLQAAMDHMAVPPALVGDVYLNLRTFPIRVGNVVEDGKQAGYSGDFYPDCQELTWQKVAEMSGMPPEEAAKLAERERTTVTKRIRRVSTFSWLGLRDAVRVNGVTKISVNFIQYLDWSDAGLKGGREAIEKLSRKAREFVDRVEAESGVPVVLIGTGARHDEMIDLE